MRGIDLNVDLGEGGSADAELIALASSVNIACGGHAGDADSMQRAIAQARAQGVAIGAHPSWEDREHFGRRPLDLSPQALAEQLRRQLLAFRAAAEQQQAAVSHVKPHGALYHQADGDPALAGALVEGVGKIFPAAAVTGPPGGELEQAARRVGRRFLREGFADRRYGRDGRLVPRSEPGAVIDDPHEALQQALDLAEKVETLCVHGDGAAALDVLRGVREGLLSAAWAVRPPVAIF